MKTKMMYMINPPIVCYFCEKKRKQRKKRRKTKEKKTNDKQANNRLEKYTMT